MFISKVNIRNYRGFKNINVSLSKLSIIVGENDTGKSNFFSALCLPLSCSNYDINQKKLSVSDINTGTILNFYDSIIKNEDVESILSKVPFVSVTIQFKDPKGFYESEILSKWLTEIDGEVCFEIRYEFKPKNENEFIQITKDLLKDCKNLNETKWFTLPIEYYDYSIVSTNNNKTIAYNDLKHITISSIDAERDDFSNSTSMKSNGVLTRLLIKTLTDQDKSKINQAYSSFFAEFEKTDIFKKVLKTDPEFQNVKNFIEDIECIPNLPNLKHILSNITLGYGDEFLYQKGLGERNLVYIFLLFTYFKSSENYFNICTIEEPEAHLSVNNLRLAIDYISKCLHNSGSMFQVLISTHNPSVINKLELTNVISFTGTNVVNFSTAGQPLVDYLRKRPNFDILKLLFADRVILVEGPSEEMLINTIIRKDNTSLCNVEVIAIGQKGYRTFLDIWLHLNKDNIQKKIGIIRDFDNQPNAKLEHDKYGKENSNIIVRTTEGYTLEDDLVSTSTNCKVLSELFKIECNTKSVSDFLKSDKTNGMLTLCEAMSRDKEPISIITPKHISEVLEALK